ncbi:methyltransferase domain-containing protein [Streptomyces uncialis]|uniref:methyltransferase domain-containing protein n=1 Tax=Streptomyces uncialis TaxID=1048205 RepID=UPI00386F3E37|nr:class I SAM-dependent methyltransferase [Streptomyces uncialis]
MREGYDGSGPGAITPDGCSVEVYARLPLYGEPDIIAAAVPETARLLELGCGVGRMTGPLVERGFTVTAVDESAEMLERVRGARTVRSPIESLELGELFDAVTLTSFLVHAGDEGVRRGLLDTCRRHIGADGCVIIQREPLDQRARLPYERVDPAGFTVRMSSEPAGDGVDLMRAEYVFPDTVWRQRFLSRALTREAFEAALAESGLRVDRYLTDDGTWVRAVPTA